MSVELRVILVCDSCGTVRGHETALSLVSAVRYVRNSGASAGWTTFGSMNQLDECAECSADPRRTQQIRSPLALSPEVDQLVNDMTRQGPIS